MHSLGLRYMVDVRPVAAVRRKADLVFRTERLAIYMDGCFWHGCPQHYTAPAAHADYWKAKLHGNQLRDVETDRVLAAAGWTTLRFWEHEDPIQAASQVRSLLLELRQK